MIRRDVATAIVLRYGVAIAGLYAKALIICLHARSNKGQRTARLLVQPFSLVVLVVVQHIFVAQPCLWHQCKVARLCHVEAQQAAAQAVSILIVIAVDGGHGIGRIQVDARITVAQCIVCVHHKIPGAGAGLHIRQALLIEFCNTFIAACRRFYTTTCQQHVPPFVGINGFYQCYIGQYRYIAQPVHGCGGTILFAPVVLVRQKREQLHAFAQAVPAP